MDTLSEFKCKICDNTKDNKWLKIKEMHFGTFDEFNYFECGVCKCIQIVNVPEDMNKHYPSNYYSYSFPSKGKNLFIKKLTKFIKSRLVIYYSDKFNAIGFFFSIFYNNPFPWLLKDMANFNTKILDVGTGAGRLLHSMQRSGFKNLTGIDPFLEKDLYYENGLQILKRDLFQVEDKFDFIMLHHSFEHMDRPFDIFKKLYDLLTENGIILVRIPVTGGYAWRKYRENWVQLDAPRHFFIHSVRSMQILSSSTGLKIVYIKNDSSTLQFTGSEKYLRGISLMSDDLRFTDKQMRFFHKESIRLNKIMDGDAACFYLKKQF